MASPRSQQALVLEAKDQPVSVQTVPFPSVTPGAAVVKILSASLPPMSRGVFTGKIPWPHNLPLVPGSTAIGRIHALGPDATTITEGQLVFVDIHVRSRDDPAASILLGWMGGFDTSSTKLMEGEWRNGCLAEYAKVPLENVYPLNEGLLVGKMGYSFADLNWIGPCVVAAGGLMEIDLKAGDTVIVAPATGFFSGAAVHLALGMGAKVIAAARNADALAKMAKTFGSTERFITVTLSGGIDKDTAALKEASGSGKGADAYIDLIPSAASTVPHLPACLAALRPFGRCALMGGTMANVEIPYLWVMSQSIRIQGRYMFDREHVLQVIKLIESRMMMLGEGAGSGIQAKRFNIADIEQALDVSQQSGWGTMVVIEA